MELEEISDSVTVDENNNTTIDFNTLIEKNSDTVGFIKVNGTDINYPVVKSNDNDYYLTHSYDKSVSGAGWIFADYNPNNKNVTFITENGSAEYEVFSVYQIESEDYYLNTSFDNASFLEFINKLKERSINNFETEVNELDSILTLSTCANDNRYRVALHAKKIEKYN